MADQMTASLLVADSPAISRAHPPPAGSAVGNAATETTAILKDSPRLPLSFLDLTCRVKSSTGLTSSGMRTILHAVSGVAKPGELLAILGPSGSGKTTLLDTLSLRKASGAVQGEIKIGQRSPKRLFLQYGAYCPQEDILNASLTVRETLRYAALLRLPFSMAYTDKMARVEEILQLLGLKHVEHSRVGGGFLRGLSGGERRRVSIGIELITSPSLLLLDEPTSGLDAKTAMDVMHALKNMASAGMTVICTIHQPSSQIYELFDKLILLSQGHLVYNGSAPEAAAYFSSLGHDCPVGWNVADFFLEIVSQPASCSQLIEAYETSAVRDAVDADLRMEHGYSRMDQRPSHARERQRAPKDSRKRGSGLYSMLPCTEPYPSPWLYQFWVLLQRNAVCLVKNPVVVLVVALGYALCGLMMGALFADLTTNVDNQVTLCLAFMIDVFGLNAFFAIMTFMGDAAVFRRERASGYYPTSVYFLSRVLFNAPINLLITLMFSAIIFGMVGIAEGDWSRFPMMLLYNYLVLETFFAITELFGAIFSTLELAIVVCGALDTIIMLFNGAFVNYTNIPKYLKWCYWASPTTYALSGVLLIEFADTDEGLNWLNIYGVQIYDEWTCAYVLMGFVVGFRLLAYLALMLTGRSRK